MTKHEDEVTNALNQRDEKLLLLKHSTSSLEQSCKHMAERSEGKHMEVCSWTYAALLELSFWRCREGGAARQLDCTVLLTRYINKL